MLGLVGLDLMSRYGPTISTDIMCKIGFEVVKCRKLSFKAPLGSDDLDDSCLFQTRYLWIKQKHERIMLCCGNV